METPFSKITIRCTGTVNGIQKVKFLLPDIANNSRLMRISGTGFTISDPNYDAKMEAFRAKRAYVENGSTKEPIKESFAPAPVETKPEPKIDMPKNEEPVKRKRGRQAGSKNKSKIVTA